MACNKVERLSTCGGSMNHAGRDGSWEGRGREGGVVGGGIEPGGGEGRRRGGGGGMGGGEVGGDGEEFSHKNFRTRIMFMERLHGESFTLLQHSGELLRGVPRVRRGRKLLRCRSSGRSSLL